jgi:HAD superfamily hydrolase (TIGR01509 family)
MGARFALLFDLDGTLVDTDLHHLGAYNELLSGYGRSITIDDYRRHVMGFANDDIMQRLFPDQSSARHVELADRKEALFRARLSQLTPTAGLLRLLAWADERSYPMAVVTNAPMSNTRAMLEGLLLSHRFRRIIVGETLAHGKPHPLPYQTALDQLGMQPFEAIAFEDSASGVKSASSAGIVTIGMTTSLDEASLRAAGARDTIRDFEDPRLRRWLPQDGAAIDASAHPRMG